jgi:putative ABC transport system permease protein
MLKNYIKIAWRTISRNKANSIINVAGLAIGIASVLLIVFYVQDELKYDRFFKEGDQIYQVNMTGSDNGNEFMTGNTAPAVGPALVASFPEVETFARIFRPGDVMVRYEQGKEVLNYFTEKRILAVDSNFLQVFSYNVVKGDPATCLDKSNSIVLSEQTAKKYFGEENPIGKILLFDNEKTPFTVTAVLQNIRAQSSFEFDMLAPISSYPVVKKRNWNWSWLQVSTYVKLKDNLPANKAAIQSLEAKFPVMVKTYAFKRGQSYEDFVKKGGKLEYHLQPFTSVHLYAAGMGTASRLTTLGDIKYIRIFSIIALFIIILACVNFMNLSTAQAVKRAKEVGIRKVLGSLKKQLVKQFLIEALLYSAIATAVALILVLVLITPFNEVTGKDFSFNLVFKNYTLLFVTGIFLLTGLLAGSYPALYLTSFKPVIVLKGMKFFPSKGGNNFIRNGLVVFQFTISIILIIATLVVFGQLDFARNQNLGLNNEGVVVIANTDRLGNSEEAFRHELTKLNGVVNATVCSSIPTKVNFGDSYVAGSSNGDEPVDTEIGLSSFMVDENFIPTLQLQVLKGRNFSKNFRDSSSVILNETAAAEIGWKTPVGKLLDYPGNSQKFTVVGVVKDFSIESVRNKVAPFALFHTSSNTYNLGLSYVSVRLKQGSLDDKLKELENKWQSFAPNTPFDFSFLDSEFESQYRSEARMGTVVGIFTGVSLFIACLGLFGLATYTAQRRTKEIGVRKVLGASVQGVVALLSRDFILLVLLAAFIAFPIAWWSMNKWLEDFAYRINISWNLFITAGLSALVIALVTVGFQAIKAAIANPVKSLRNE